MPVSKAFFWCLSDSPKNVFLIEKSHPSLLSSWERIIPSMFPKTGPLWKNTPVSRALFNISFRIPSEGALPPGSHHKAPTDRDAPFPGPSFICPSKSLVNEAPRGSRKGPLWREMPVSRAFLYTSFRVPSKAAPHPGSPIRASMEINAPFQSPPSSTSPSPR